jgi:hypothetical protein
MDSILREAVEADSNSVAQRKQPFFLTTETRPHRCKGGVLKMPDPTAGFH